MANNFDVTPQLADGICAFQGEPIAFQGDTCEFVGNSKASWHRIILRNSKGERFEAHVAECTLG